MEDDSAELPEDPTLLTTAQYINQELRAIQDRGIGQDDHADVLLSRRQVEIILDALQDKLSRVQQSEGADTEIARLKRVIERERTWSATWVERVKAEIEKRRSISQSRGPYEWDDEAYFKEFGQALDAIEAAVGRAGRDLHVTDLTDCPTTNAEVQRARTEQADASDTEIKKRLNKSLQTHAEALLTIARLAPHVDDKLTIQQVYDELLYIRDGDV